MDHRLLFFGTPEFAVPTLVALTNSFTVSGVVTQPDRPTGRGRKLIPSAVKLTADYNQLEIFQPQDINSAPALDKIRSWKPDLICVAAFGQILSPDLIALPEFGCLNVHASLLPRWRGASPINAAILAGDGYSGVTIMKMAAGLDNGPILNQIKIELKDQETAGTLSVRLANLGAELLVKTIPSYISGDINPFPQDDSQATYAGLLNKHDGLLNYGTSAEELSRKVRAYNPWPGTFTYWRDERILIHQSRAISVTSPGIGVFIIYEGMPAVGTSAGILVFDVLQLAGKKKLSGNDFLRGISEWDKATSPKQ